jgi:hypothetical protein
VSDPEGQSTVFTKRRPLAQTVEDEQARSLALVVAFCEALLADFSEDFVDSNDSPGHYLQNCQ